AFKLKVPPGYQIEEMPEGKVIMLPGNTARYAFNTTLTGDVLTVTSILSINKAIYTQVEYPNLREFFNQVVATQSGQIILKKLQLMRASRLHRALFLASTHASAGDQG